MGSLREKLTQQTVGVLIRAALSGGMRIGEVDTQIEPTRKRFVLANSVPLSTVKLCRAAGGTSGNARSAAIFRLADRLSYIREATR